MPFQSTSLTQEHTRSHSHPTRDPLIHKQDGQARDSIHQTKPHALVISAARHKSIIRKRVDPVTALPVGKAWTSQPRSEAINAMIGERRVTKLFELHHPTHCANSPSAEPGEARLGVRVFAFGDTDAGDARAGAPIASPSL